MRPALLLLALLAVVPAASAAPAPDSGPLVTDASWSTSFDSVGTFEYLCKPHPFMVARVVVTEDPGANESAEVAIDGFEYKPSDVYVKPGATVTWTNRDEASHTVTFQSADAATEVPGLALALTLTAAGASALLLARRGAQP